MSVRDRNRQAIAETVRGHARAASFLESERIANLRQLTPEASLAMFTALWTVWERSGQGGDAKALDSIKIKHLVDRRRALDRLASWRASA